MQFLQPTKCSYVVVLESALFCPKLQSVDALGMFPAMAAGDADPQQHEQQVPAEKVATKRKFSAAGTVELDLMNQVGSGTRKWDQIWPKIGPNPNKKLNFSEFIF